MTIFLRLKKFVIQQLEAGPPRWTTAYSCYIIVVYFNYLIVENVGHLFFQVINLTSLSTGTHHGQSYRESYVLLV